MRRTRRSKEYRRAQGGRRTALPFVRIEAPVGGWNSRDSEDNVPPTDALEFDNWWPDIGEVRTRPGYSVHCALEDAISGSNLVSNGSFETAGAGGLDVFANWVEAAAVGIGPKFLQSTTIVEDGTYSCEFSLAGAPRDNPSYIKLSQQITVTADELYRLVFYDTTQADTYYTGVYYKIYDDDNGADIVSWTMTNNYGDTMTKNTVLFTAPSGCTNVTILFLSGWYGVSPIYADVTKSTFVDAVSVYKIVASPTHVETLAEYISGSGRDLIAFSGEEAFDVSSSTPAHLSSALGAFDNARFQWVNFDGKAGFVNGVDKLQWDGTTLSALAITGDKGAGVAALTPIGVNVFKGRTWFWHANEQDVYYSALNTLGGLCTKFPLSRVGQFGGNLILMETWTRDGGSGPDDFAVFVMSSGEAIVYQGSYPGAAGDWALVGIYNIGEPIGYRSAVKFGGDLYLITRLDVVRMSEVIQGAEARQMETKIVPSHRSAVSLYGALWGWQASIYPKGHMAIFNIPTDENVAMEQHAQNTITGAWARFKGIVANTWQSYDGDMYIGSSEGKIYKFDDGEIDYEDSIESTFQTAWMPIGGTGANKLFKAVRESYKTNASVTVSNRFATDFKAFAAQLFPIAFESSGALWSVLPSTTAVSPWDTTPWTAGDAIYNEWETIGAFGERVSMRKRLNTNQRVTLLGYDWLVEPGDRL